LLILLIAVACNAGPRLQLSVYGEAFSTPFDETAYLDCRLNCQKWQEVVTPYIAFTKYTTFSEVTPLYGLGLDKTWAKDRFFVEASTAFYNDKTWRFMLFTTVDVLK
jgi:hypothetical protein